MQISIPTTCPCCGYTLELINSQLFCRNIACDAQLAKQVEHFTKTLKIKGFGPQTVKKLGLGDITELYYLELDDVASALGSVKMAEKLLAEIAASRNADLATVLAAFSIPLIGNTASTKIASVVSSVDEITVEKCKEAGLGEKATNNLINWLNTDFVDLREFLPFTFKSSNKTSINTDGDTVCITGKLKSFKTKAEANKLLEQAGYKVVDSVTKTLKYLVDEANDGSSKRKKADEYGITIINNLLDFLKKD